MEIENKDTEPLTTGQIVWGKLSGQPWWPAIIVDILEVQPNPVIITFIGHITQAQVTREQVRNFQQWKQELKPKRGMRLKRAFQVAERVSNGESDIQEELLNFETDHSEKSRSNMSRIQKSVLNESKLMEEKVVEEDKEGEKGCVFRAPTPRIYEKNLKLKIQKSRLKLNIMDGDMGDLRYLPEEHQSIDIPNRGRLNRSRSRSKSRSKIARFQNNRMIGALCSQISEKSSSTANFSDFENFNFPEKNENLSKIGSNFKSTNLIFYIDSLTTRLSQIRDKELTDQPQKERLYQELATFVSRCFRIELDFGLLVNSKLGKYLHLIYVMLLEINDIQSLEYQNLLPRLSKLRKSAKRKIVSYFSGVRKRNKEVMLGSGSCEHGKEEKEGEMNTKEKIEYLLKSQSSEYCGSQIGDDQSVVVSLLDKEKTMKENSRRRRRYRKDLHFLKLVYQERTSRMSSTNQEKRDKPLLGEVSENMKQSLKSSRLGIKTPVSFGTCFSRLNSSISSSSQKNRAKNFEDYFPRGNKNMSLNDILTSKKYHRGDINNYPALRKKIIKKLFEIFYKEKSFEKNFSKKMAIFIEENFHQVFNSSSNLYIEKIRQFSKKFRLDEITTEDIKTHLQAQNMITAPQKDQNRNFQNFLTIYRV